VTAEIIHIGVRSLDTNEMLLAWEKWDGNPGEDILGFDYEDIFWELHRRGCAPVIG